MEPGGEDEENVTIQWRVCEGQIVVSDPGPMWNATRFLIAGILFRFLASGQRVGLCDGALR